MGSCRLYTVGHSNQSQEDFLELLKRHDINCIVDVRSVPASKFTPQFNMESLKWYLRTNGIQYLHFGDEFGARRTDCLDTVGQVNFELAVKTPSFKRGVERLMNGFTYPSCVLRQIRWNVTDFLSFHVIFLIMVSMCNIF